LRSFNSLDIGRLLVRMPNWIGDAVMATPALMSLRAALPEAEIVVLAPDPVAPLFESHPGCDRVLRPGKEGGRLSRLLQTAALLRREKFDAAVLLQNAIEAALVSRLAGIRCRAGYRTDGRSLLLSHGVAIGAAHKRLHHTDYYQLMLADLGLPLAPTKLTLACTWAEQEQAAATLGPGSWVAVNPGAAYGSAKRWYPDRFAAVADQLVAEFDISVVLTGGPGESEIGRDIAAAMKTAPRNLIGKTSVRELMAILQHCHLVVTNDSGPMHVAAAFGTPIVAVFGPTDHTTTSPRSDQVRIVRKDVDCAPCLLRQCPTDHRCMTSVTVADVVSAARELLVATP
jgi:heptosyltransferase-2